MFIFNIQFQRGGHHNTQVIRNDVPISLGAILNKCIAQLEERLFKSEEVKKKYFERVNEINKLIKEDHQCTIDWTVFIIFPFKTNAEDEILNDKYFIAGILDTLSVMAFSDIQFELVNHHVNISLGGRRLYGIYYREGDYKLVDSFQSLLNSLNKKMIEVPPECHFIILNNHDDPLDPNNIKNLVTNILGDNDFIDRVPFLDPLGVEIGKF